MPLLLYRALSGKNTKVNEFLKVSDLVEREICVDCFPNAVLIAVFITIFHCTMSKSKCNM